MKSIIAAIVFCFAAFTGTAQGFFNQKGEQIKKYIEQIGLLKTYLRQAQRGYDIVDKGLNTIKDIKKGEFNLHDLYYKSLKAVNPEIRRLSKVDAAIETGTAALRRASQMVRATYANDKLDASEKRYIVSVLGKIIDDAEKDLRYLDDLIAADRIALTDDERIGRINRVFVSLGQTSKVLQRFKAELQVLLRNRSGQLDDVDQMIRLNNLKK